MDNFKAIYKILSFLAECLDYEIVELDFFTADNFEISKTKFNKLLNELLDRGYISGVSQLPVIGTTTPPVKIKNPRITLAGLEYLESDLMRRARLLLTQNCLYLIIKKNKSL